MIYLIILNFSKILGPPVPDNVSSLEKRILTLRKEKSELQKKLEGKG